MPVAGREYDYLDQAVTQSRRAFYRAAGMPVRVTTAAPILFFGDHSAYRASPLRVLTVGLNPSLHEFPKWDSRSSVSR